MLDDVDLEVADGRTTVLLGPSGCGKTTLLRLIAGLDPLDAGTVEVGDRLVSGPGVHVAPERRGIGLVFQDGALFPHLSVGRNIGYGLERASRRSGPRIDELAELVGLAGATDRAPEQLSGGEQQRVALARALGPAPDVLLLDEPFSNLDAVLRERLRDQVRAIVSDAGMTTVFVTHDRVEAFALADEVALMRDGRIAQVGAPVDVYRRPVDRWAAGLLGDVVVLAGASDGVAVSTEIGRLAVAEGGAAAGRVEVLARPEDLVLSALDARAGGSGSRARIDGCQAEGSTWAVTLRLPSGVRTRARGLGACPWMVGDLVSIRVGAPVWTVAEGSPEQ